MSVEEGVGGSLGVEAMSGNDAVDAAGFSTSSRLDNDEETEATEDGDIVVGLG